MSDDFFIRLERQLEAAELRELNRALAVLTDPAQRRAYDERLRVEMIPGFHMEIIEGRFSDARETPLLRLRGPMRSLLSAERVVLNFLQHLSGIATHTHRFARRVAGTVNVSIGSPVPHVSAHVEQAVAVGGEGLDRRGAGPPPRPPAPPSALAG